MLTSKKFQVFFGDKPIESEKSKWINNRLASSTLNCNIGHNEDSVSFSSYFFRSKISNFCFQVHLQNALKKNEAIPTPDVISIDPEIYEKLYPVMKQPKFDRLIRTLREIFYR